MSDTAFVEIRGVNTVNKGAELMLRAVVRALSGDVRLALGPRSATYQERAVLRLEQRVESAAGDGLLEALSRVVPARLARNYGLVFPGQLTAVLDASGFSYSDQFGPERARAAALRARRDERHGRRWVLLPQAVGPFREFATRDAFRELVASSVRCYVRDRVSMQYALDAGVDEAKLKLQPDFTSSMPGRAPEGPAGPPFMAVVVNQKVLDKAGQDEAARYVDFLVQIASNMSDAGLRPRLVVHERRDKALAREVEARLDGALPAVLEDDPQVLKGWLGAATAILGSRYHALVGGLSQGVPTVAVGWSHKYQELFRDYGVPEGVVRTDQVAEATRLLSEWTGSFRTTVRDRLLAASAEHARLEGQLWNEVRELVR